MLILVLRMGLGLRVGMRDRVVRGHVLAELIVIVVGFILGDGCNFLHFLMLHVMSLLII